MIVRLRRTKVVSVVTLLGILTSGAYAAEVSIKVTTHKGKPLGGAVVTALFPGSIKADKRSGKTVIDQIKQEFVPHVLVVQKGTPVYFPNKDDIRHHVYSFSKPREFELPLYKGTPAEPVVFDKLGAIKLGCNIHDWMLGYIYVVDTPHHAVTDKSGAATFSDLPMGIATITVWHPRMKGKPEEMTRQITLSAIGSSKMQYQIKVRWGFRIRRARGKRGGRYR